MDKDRAFKTLALTEVNTHILDAARDSISEEQEREFFCECGRLTATSTSGSPSTSTPLFTIPAYPS